MAEKTQIHRSQCLEKAHAAGTVSKAVMGLQ